MSVGHKKILLTFSIGIPIIGIPMNEISDLRARIAALGLRKGDVAAAAGLDQSMFSQYLNGRREPPADFEGRVTAALDRLERAERAAEEARAKVLAGGAA